MVSLLALALIQHAAVAPVSRPDTWWQDRHAACVVGTKIGGFDVAFIGDSITEAWDSSGKAAWDDSFGPMKAANYGFSGDRTQHVLWRLDNGEVIDADPKVVVLMIGTNNIGVDSPAEISDGVTAIVDRLLAKTRTKILLLGIFPRAEAADHPLRVKVGETTDLFFNRIENPRVLKLDISSYFIRSDGSLRTLLMPDALHLNENGYVIWAKAILPRVREMLGG